MQRDRLYAILRKYWGYESFRPLQLEVIEAVCAGRDTLALMPTGAGKSLLYQLPGAAMTGVCIVVTPLIALMKDQVDRLRARGINAAALHSGLTMRQADIVLDNASWGDLKFLYVAPERVANATFRSRLRTMNVSLLAVDEAHCISQWGYDFRPAYLRIAELRELLPEVPVLALTATATPAVAEDVMRHLKMTDGCVLRSTFARPNLSFAVRRTEDKYGQLLRVLNNVAGAGVIYVRTRETAEKLAQWIGEQTGDSQLAEFYHGGLGHAERTIRQERWTSGARRLMVATNAFGMGIDKADVRFVVHYDIPDSLEAYYQEAGRAGRDGRRSYAVLLTASDDRSRAVRRFENEFPPIEKIKECYEALFNYFGIGIGDGKFASFDFNIHDFAKRARMYTGTAYNAIRILQQNGYMTLGGETDNPPRIMFAVGRDELYKIRIEREELDHIIRTLLRLYAGVFHDRLVPVDVREIASMSGYTAERVREFLKQLWQMRIIRYIPGSRSPVLFIDEERLPSDDVFISPESYRIRKQMDAERLEGIFVYAEGTGCRSVVIQRYFGEEDAADCGTCDVCLERRRMSGLAASSEASQMRDDVEHQIVAMLCEGPMTVKQIVGKFLCPPELVTAALDRLTAAGKISAGGDGKLKYMRVSSGLPDDS
ncbi:MAG: RecQ family ATP-dependent DNA helicase [Rikenellaceae bacterium]|nr:RecQ family ATP-dependent DNA helicase [Rikenellaceae bacterium]MCL2693392.1 RecQ family ATP-dependent DNA helicase [Rikenellaceae bacterium]